MIVHKTSPLSGKVQTRDLPITERHIERWWAGELIQDVMPHLSAADREWLISGITPEEWAQLEDDAA